VSNFPPRLAALARRWESLKFLVAKESVSGPASFYRSWHYWHSGELNQEKGWSLEEIGDLFSPHSFNEEASVLIRGDCRGDLTLKKGGLIQIFGDLNSKIEIGDQGEIVIGGSLLPHAVIEADYHHHIFVRGNVDGSIRSRGSLQIWVYGDFRGQIQTGHPTTVLYVAGDVSGRIEPVAKASLLYLDVEGFTSYETLTSIAAHGYTEFNASVGVSDRPSGFYPPDWKRRVSQRHRCRWAIHRSNQSLGEPPQDLGPHGMGD
jgi:cytoskeletal protein CcmA (bactofilin family)